MAELGGLAQELSRRFQIARAGAAFEIKHGEREHGVAVAVAGSELVPFGGFGVVARHAVAVRVKLTEQGHGDGIVRSGALGGFGEGGEIMAALVGAVGEIVIGIVCGDGRRRLRHRNLGRLRDGRRGERDDAERYDREAPRGRHAAVSGRRNSSALRTIVAATSRGSRQSQSPSATKSAPAFTSGTISSIDAA